MRMQLTVKMTSPHDSAGKELRGGWCAGVSPFDLVQCACACAGTKSTVHYLCRVKGACDWGYACQRTSALQDATQYAAKRGALAGMWLAWYLRQHQGPGLLSPRHVVNLILNGTIATR
jgi:hypothetical protein